MAIVLGSSTTANIGGTSNGIQSVSWGAATQSQHLWELGSFIPFKTQLTLTVNCSVSAYAGEIGSVTLVPSEECEDSGATKQIFISAVACGGAAVDGMDSEMFLTSYSYSKQDGNTLGTENWSFQGWLLAEGAGANIINMPAPSYVLQGIAEGSFSGSSHGIAASTTYGSSSQGQVSAGFPGVGTADTTTTCIPTAVGGGALSGSSYGQGSASIPHQPIYVPTS